MTNKFLAVFFTATALLGAVVPNAIAAFVIDGTRVIFDGAKNTTSFNVTNESDRTFGGQVWLSNVSQAKEVVYMVPYPSFFKVSAKGSLAVRIMNVNPGLPKDRESLFMLNVQEVPPMPEKTEDGSAQLALAMNTQIKLIYRPKGLAEGRKDAEKKLSSLRRDGRVWLKNPTPYYFAVLSVKSGSRKLPVPDSHIGNLTTLAPFSEADTGLSDAGGALSVDAIDDWGGVQNYGIQ